MRKTLNQNYPLRLTSIIYSLIVLLLLVGSSVPPGQVAASTPEPHQVAEFVPGRVIVKLKSDPAGGFQSAKPLFSGPFSDPAIASELGLERVYLLELSDGEDLFTVINSLSNDPVVEYAEPDYILTTAVIPNDEYFTIQWGMNNTGQIVYGSRGKIDADIDMPEAWEITKGSQDIIVAIVDTGADSTHPDLVSKLVPGYNTVDENNNTEDYNGHGTHVAGIAAAATNNTIGVAGVCWECKIMPIKALGTNEGTITDVAEGIRYAADHGAHVINLSIEGPSGNDTLLSAIRYAYLKNIPVVAAMGNQGTAEKRYPAAYPETIAVGATDKFDVRADYSSYGEHIDLVAPGSEIASTYYLDQYYYMSGTSMAAPHVSGVLGLMRSISPTKTVEGLRATLRDSADDLGADGWDIYYGAGRLNAYQALKSLEISSISIRPPSYVLLNRPAAFTASVSPATAGTPITYTWTATDQKTITGTSNSLTSKVTFTWSKLGAKTVRVTATNALSTRSSSITVLVGRPFFLPTVRHDLQAETPSQ
jgi:subtilisin family serine protease